MSKYPKKYKGVKTGIKFPVFVESKWGCYLLSKKGEITKTSRSDYSTEEHAWVVCNAFNKRVGYEKKEVEKIIKKYYLKEKPKKEKRSKKNKTSNNFKESKKRRFFRVRQVHNKERKKD